MVDLLKALKNAPTLAAKATLVRAVASRALFSAGIAGTSDFLFTSGKPNRFNPPGTECLYLAEDEATALAEYRRQFEGLAHGAKQPVTLFYAEVRLGHVLDISDGATRRALGLTLKELESDWGGGLPTTLAQMLGVAVAQQSKICAIRYRSVAAVLAGFSGHNMVIFKNCITPTDFVRILGPTKAPLQAWP